MFDITGYCFSIQKSDNYPFENADAYSLTTNGVIFTGAIADGVSTALYSRHWAKLLVNEFVQSADLFFNGILSDIVAESAKKWNIYANKQIQRKFGKNVPYWVQNGLVNGALSTFLGAKLSLESGKYEALAVGDSCLFHVRNENCLTSFPICDSNGFTTTPKLLHTLTWRKQPEPVYAKGNCETGDILALSSDAMAQYILKSIENGRAEIWGELISIRNQTEWWKYIKNARKCYEIHDDDTTLIILKIL